MSIPRPYDYITAESLAEKLKSDPSNLKIVDVRDDDFVGGNIPSAINIRSTDFDDYVERLVLQLKGGESFRKDENPLSRTNFRLVLHF